MTLDELVMLAMTKGKAPSISTINEFCAQEGIALDRFFDRFAERVANRYLAGDIEWGQGDLAMNFASARIIHSGATAPYAWEVYLAFDAGEINPGPAITKPLLEKAEAKRNGRSAPEADTAIIQVESDALEQNKLEAISLARKILSGELGLLAGCRDLYRLTFVHRPWNSDADFEVFSKVAAETNHLPLDDAKEMWASSVFQAKQVAVKEYEAKCRPSVIRACESLIKKWSC
jgi:hypothetical protein